MLSGTGSFIAFSYSVLFYSDFLGGREIKKKEVF